MPCAPAWDGGIPVTCRPGDAALIQSAAFQRYELQRAIFAARAAATWPAGYWRGAGWPPGVGGWTPPKTNPPPKPLLKHQTIKHILTLFLQISLQLHPQHPTLQTKHPTNNLYLLQPLF